jgi:hypothetical protein
VPVIDQTEPVSAAPAPPCAASLAANTQFSRRKKNAAIGGSTSMGRDTHDKNQPGAVSGNNIVIGRTIATTHGLWNDSTRRRNIE